MYRSVKENPARMPFSRLSYEVRANLRQWRQPKEFRIRATAWPQEALAALSELSAAAPQAPPQAASDAASDAAPDGLTDDAVAEMATSIWRLQSRTAGAAEGELPRSVVRHIEKASDVLVAAGVEIQDHLHDPFDPGLALNVVAVQPTSGLQRETVIETIRPSVYLNDRPIQRGEIIVGTPDTGPNP